MKKDKMKRGSLISLLIGNYILFTTILVFVVFLLMIIFGQWESRLTQRNYVDEVGKYEALLKKGEYDRIPASTLVGKRGYIEIINQSGENIYSSTWTKGSYTSKELNCIVDIENIGNIYTQQFYTENQEKQILITLETYEGGENRYILLDENHQIISDNWGLGQRTLSEREFAFLSGGGGNKQIGKFAYAAENGEQHILIMHTDYMSSEESFRIYQKLQRYEYILLIGLYLAIICLFTIWLNRKIRKPLRLLNSAIITLMQEEDGGDIAYKGPVEFVQICEDFNSMRNQLNESEKQRKHLEAEKQKMVADISHDLKTPITVIQGYSKAIYDGVVPENKINSYLRTIYKKSCILNGLIETFFEYSKRQHPQYKLELERIDISEFSREYFAGKYDEFEIHGYKLSMEIPEESIYCMIDTKEMTRVYDNLISNYFKYNEPGTTLYYGLISDEKICIRIADDGVGIPKESRGSIFQPFIMGSTTRSGGQGSGLGLAIVERIIQAHGGIIRLMEEVKEPYHTEFVIELDKVK